ncbi:RIP metalloprotease RseP [Thioclava sp. SK-1]|uniref:RIP metalloprotease RseP n=1 Tax=Thioclava sp. SK-1 TaxID=1889770 RepID=UPI0008267A56|nr:RIP metalloprotease RseP [Thioclava sp. SK-1]OCX67092.1 RIP metalloprotease RseP [Thioclava sp. SK-1]
MEFLPDFGNLLYTVVVFVVALSIIVTVHEYGHYIVGRWSGIKADVFSIGFGPKLFSRVDKHGTRWQVALLPLGGYVKFRGDADPASAQADDAEMAALTAEERRHTMHGAPLWARMATVVAGPVFNFILSIVVIFGLMMWSGTAVEEPIVEQVVALPQGAGDLLPGDRIIGVNGVKTPDYAALNDGVDTLPDTPMLDYRVSRDGAEHQIEGPQLFPPRLAGVAPQSAAYDAGLQAGDVIAAVNGTPIWRFANLQSAVKASDGAALDLQIWRPDQGMFDVTLAPKRTDLPKADGGFETRWLIGASGSFVFTPQTRPTTVSEAATGAVKQTFGIVTQSISALRAMITQEISSCNMRGAIGIAEGSAAAAKAGFTDFIWFIAMLSTAVGFLNLFPIPVLDGGHLMFHIWEGITGNPPPPAAMNVLMMIGIALVASLMLFGLSNDILCP